MVQPLRLTPDQVKRYSRHIIMQDVGSAGQRKMMESSALIIGAGGLGSPSAVYLALAGVGKLGIVDFDVVELSNLQRQILHHTPDVGRPKVQSAIGQHQVLQPRSGRGVARRVAHLRERFRHHRPVRHRDQRRGQLSPPATWSTTPAIC